MRNKKNAAKALIEQFESKDIQVRTDAANKLSFMDSPPLKEIIEALEKGSYLTRECAAYVLGNVGDKTALKPLRHAYIFDSNSSVVNRASEALDKLIKKYKLTGEWWKDL